MYVKSRHRNRIDEGCRDALGAVRRVQKEMMGYVIHSSRGLDAVWGWVSAVVLLVGAWMKMRWCRYRCTQNNKKKPLRASVTSSTFSEIRLVLLIGTRLYLRYPCPLHRHGCAGTLSGRRSSPQLAVLPTMFVITLLIHGLQVVWTGRDQSQHHKVYSIKGHTLGWRSRKWYTMMSSQNRSSGAGRSSLTFTFKKDNVNSSTSTVLKINVLCVLVQLLFVPTFSVRNWPVLIANQSSVS